MCGGTATNGVFKSEDGGASWQQSSANYNGGWTASSA